MRRVLECFTGAGKPVKCGTTWGMARKFESTRANTKREVYPSNLGSDPRLLMGLLAHVALNKPTHARHGLLEFCPKLENL
jgi:hypothetical protein